MPGTIRPLVPEDIPEVVALSLRAWAPVFESFRATLGEQIYRALYPDWLASQARDVETVCRDDAVTVWVAERDGRPAGFVALRVNQEERAGEIDMIAGRPAGPAPGHLHQLPQRHAGLSQEAALRHRPDRKVVPERL